MLGSRELFRSGRWHTKKSTFRLISGPSIIGLGQTLVIIQWTMSELCQGQVEYGTSPDSLTQTSTLESSFTYDTHAQTISGLDPATTYYFRTKSTSQSGVVVYSSVATFLTEGVIAPPPSGRGPRYDLYGAGAGGNFPAYPTIGGSTVMMPTSVLSASNVGAAIAAFVNAQANGTTIVWDSSGGGTDYGAGTDYVIDRAAQINAGSGVLRSGVIHHMYNTRIRNTNMSTLSVNRENDILAFFGGGFADYWIMGGTFRGAHTNAGTHNAYVGDRGHGISMWSYDGFHIIDCDFEDVRCDNLYFSQGNIAVSPHYFAYSGGAYPRDLELGWCRFGANGRMGVTIQQFSGLDVHDCIFEDAGLSGFASEDDILNALAYKRDLTFDNNIVRRANWDLNPSLPAGGRYERLLKIGTEIVGVDVVSNLVFTNNRWEFGLAGLGNPSEELAVLGEVLSSPNTGAARARAVGVPAPWKVLSELVTIDGLEFTNNETVFESDQLDSYVLNFSKVSDLVVTDNDLQGMQVRILQSPGYTFERNGTSTVRTT